MGLPAALAHPLRFSFFEVPAKGLEDGDQWSTSTHRSALHRATTKIRDRDPRTIIAFPYILITRVLVYLGNYASALFSLSRIGFFFLPPSILSLMQCKSLAHDMPDLDTSAQTLIFGSNFIDTSSWANDVFLT